MMFYFRMMFSVLLLAAAPLCAGVIPQQSEVEGQKVFILENDLARIVVQPDAGAAISSYVDKRSGIDYVAGKVSAGRAGYGWKNVTRLDQNDPSSNWLGAQPYQVQAKGDSLLATCTHGFLRVEREMSLADDSTQLAVTVRTTNVSDNAQTIWPRWHPYSKMDDLYGEHSVFLTPGPEALAVRRIRVGQGYNNEFMDVPGYWMVLNAKSGNGLWLTFKVEELMHCSAWTGTKLGRHPKRGWFVPEVYPTQVRAEPGQTLSMAYTYQPFVAADQTANLATGVVAENDREAAKRFAGLARDNAAVLREHTMMPNPNSSPSVAQQNRFFFSHLRRDRFAMLDWGIIDAMMSVPGRQSSAIRVRLFTRIFDSIEARQGALCTLTISDLHGKVLKKQTWGDSIDPIETRVIDRRYDMPLDDLPDGRYTVTLEAADIARRNVPIHRYVREVKLSEHAYLAAQTQRPITDAPPLIDRERPVVRALRTMELPAKAVPIAVEEAGGVARKDWPVRTGVPFAQGALQPGDAVVLTAPDGKAITPQTSVMSKWQDGSTRWLLVDFPANVPADSFAMYTLKTAAAAAAPKADIAKLTGNHIAINTGAAKFDVATTGNASLLGILPHDGIWWSTGDGTTYTFQPDEAGVTIDENGPQRAVLKCVGWYRAEGQSKPIARGEFRATFMQGQSWWKLSHTYTYVGNPWNDSLASMGVRFTFADQAFTGSAIALDGKPINADGAQTLKQLTEDSAAVGDIIGHRASGAAALKSASGNAAVYHHGLWRMFPKQVDADPAAGTITYHYRPDSGEPMTWKPNEDVWNPSSPPGIALAVGVSRTHDFVIHPSTPNGAETFESTFDEPVLAIVAPRYVCATDAIPGLTAYDPVNCPRLENAISEVIDSYELNRQVYGWYGQWFYGSLPNYKDNERQRWADFGRYGNIFNEQDIVQGPWLAYFRSGDRKYFNFAESNTTHLLDVGTIRLNPTWPDMAGMSRRHHEVAWLGPADYGHSMLDPFVEMYHVTGDRRAWEAAERMATAMAKQRTGAWRYIINPIAGLARMYYETGVLKYKKQADRIWTDLCYPDRNQWYITDHAHRLAMWYAPLNADCARLVKEYADGDPAQFEGIDALSILYRQTGDEAYVKRAAKVFEGQLKDAQGYDVERKDVLQWGTARHTQHVLAGFRQWVYAADILRAAKKIDAANKE